MSIHSERQNMLHNKSGNARLQIHGRSGDSEDGTELFDFMPQRLQFSPADIVEKEDERPARLEFLRDYFKLLKDILNPFEYLVMKEMFKSGSEMPEVCNKYCLQVKRISAGIKEKLSKNSDKITELVNNSDWSGARLFSRVFTLSAYEIYKNVEILNDLGDNVLQAGKVDLKVDAAKRKRVNINIYEQGYTKGKRLTRDRVKQYLVDLVGLREFKPYIQSFINEKVINILGEVKLILRLLEPERFKSIVTHLDCINADTESFDFMLKFVGSIAGTISEILNKVEAVQLFKDTMFEDTAVDVFRDDK